MARGRQATGETPAQASAPAAKVPAQTRRSLKVTAVKDGFYPKDFRRRRGSVFTLQDAAHFSDSEKERLIVRGGKTIRTGSFGWMAWAEADAPERVVSQDESAKREMSERATASDATVI